MWAYSGKRIDHQFVAVVAAVVVEVAFEMH